MPSPAGIDPGREVAELRDLLHRYRVYLGASLALFGVATLAAIALVSLYGVRLAGSLSKNEAAVADLSADTQARIRDLETALARQEQELAAIHRAATDELEAMREANRKLQSVRDPGKDLTALREANEALWRALASQRAELLRAFVRDGSSESARETSKSRFRLGETSYLDPAERSDEIKGFVKGDEKVYRASVLPSSPALLALELEPENVALGETYRLSVRLLNESNRPIVLDAMRIDWSFQGKKTGGDVPISVRRVEAHTTALLYAVSGSWTEAHADSPASVSATVTLDSGARLLNALSW